MSKNIVIAEGRRGRRFGAVKKLRTNLQGGGSCLWVPEEDVELESLYAYENGVYRPEKYGFDSASVNVVNASLTPLNTSHNTPHFPSGNNNGFSQVTVNVPESEQDTYMDAVQLKCVEIPSGKPYSIVLFSKFESDDQGVREYTECTAYYYSAFPFYLRWVLNNDHPHPKFYTFVRGESSLRVLSNWENHLNPNRRHDTTALDDAYLRNVVTEYGDGFTTNTTTAPSTIRTRMDNGIDHFVALQEWVKMVDEGEHLGGWQVQAGSVTMLKQNSTIPVEEETTSAGYDGIRIRMAIASFPPRGGTGEYSHNYMTGPYGDYRIINNKSFATMEEWLTWCKTH